MLFYCIRLLLGRGSLSDILHTLELTQSRLDTFLGSQAKREGEATEAFYTASDRRDAVRRETMRARTVLGNLNNILASPTETSQGMTGDE